MQTWQKRSTTAKQDQRFLKLEVTRLMKVRCPQPALHSAQLRGADSRCVRLQDRSSMSEHIARLERDSAFLMGERDLLLQQLEGAPCEPLCLPARHDAASSLQSLADATLAC